MENVSAALQQAVAELLGRASGPFHLRLLLQPTMATLLAIRAGRRDAREGHPPFLLAFVSDPTERQRLLHSAWKDIGKIFVVALALDAVYQLVELHGFSLLQTLLVAIMLAILPYVLLRSIVTRLTQKRKSPTS
jgi:hypothetical protein